MQLSLSFLPAVWWWPTAVFLSALLVAAAAGWLTWRIFFEQKIALPQSQKRFIAIVFVVFALVWWTVGFALTLWPLKSADDFTQWARASSYVTIPLWIGGVAWAAALLVARLLNATRAKT